MKSGKKRNLPEKEHDHEKKQKTDYLTYSFSGSEWVRYLAEGGGIGGLVVWICYRDLRAFPLAVLIAGFYLRNKRKQLSALRRKTLNYHFRDFLSSLYSVMRAGYSMTNGVRAASADVEKLFGREDVLILELREINRNAALQIPVEESFYELGIRSGVEDIMNFGEILVIARKTGGDMGKVVQNCYRTICEKIDTGREIEAAVSAKSFEQTIMSIMPAAIILYLRLAFQGFMEQLYGNPAGVIIMSAALAVYIAAFWLGRKMVKIEV